MKTYFALQAKRFAKRLWLVAVVLVALLLGASVLLLAVSQQNGDDTNNQKMRVGIVGDTDDPYLSFGLKLFQSMDSSRYTVKMEFMEEGEARRALETGKLSAYLVLPDNFLDEAMVGNIQPIECVMTAGTKGLVTLFKEEISRVIVTMVVETQKGIYGMDAAYDAHGQTFTDWERVSLKYVTLILERDELYTVEESGVTAGLPFLSSLICGLAVLLLWLSVLPYATILVTRDDALFCLLRARGITAWQQVAAEYGALVAVLLPLQWVVTAVGAVLLEEPLWRLLLVTVPLVLLAAAFHYVLFACVRNVVSGLLLSFFLTVALGYVGGCLYPLQAFPVSVQRASAVLPTALSHRLVAQVLCEEPCGAALCGVLAYTAAFRAVAVLVRYRRLARRGGGV